MIETDEGNLLINMQSVVQSVVQSCNGHKSVRPNAKKSRRRKKINNKNQLRERIKRKIYMGTIKH